MLSTCCFSRIKSGKKKNPQRITKIKPFIDKCNWNRINQPSEKDQWKKSEKNNLTNVINTLYAKMRKYTLATFQNIIQIDTNKLLF